MPPKVKISKTDILNTAVSLVRENGESAINARAIASALGCSTQPIFSNFATMEQLQEETLAVAYEIYLRFLDNESKSGKYPKYKAFGMAYIRFANEEKQLFSFLFMRNRVGKEMIPTPDFTASIELLMQENGIEREKAELMHLEMWTFVHGIGTMLATSFLSLDTDLISAMLSDVFLGLRAKHLSEEK